MKLQILIGSDIVTTEKIAIDDLRGYLQGLFGIRAKFGDILDHKTNALFIVGSPQSNPYLNEISPDVGEEGIFIRNIMINDIPGIAAGGGNAPAVLWAISRLAEAYGIRHLLHGDVYPPHAKEFYLPELDIVEEPTLSIRGWRVVNDFACGPESWGIDDYRSILHQLAKLTFNRILISLWPYQPFINPVIDGIERETSSLWFGYRYPITNDMPGRTLFGEEEEYWNPDLPPRNAPYPQMVKAAENHIHKLIDLAHGLGMDTAMTVSFLDYPGEFEPIVPDAQRAKGTWELTVVPGPNVDVDNSQLYHLAKSVIQTAVDTYPEVDIFVLSLPEWVSWTEVYKEAWNKLDTMFGVEKTVLLEELLQRAQGHNVVYDDQSDRAITEAKGNITAIYFLSKLLSDPEVVSRPSKDKVKFAVRTSEELSPILQRVLPHGSESMQQLAYTPSRALRDPKVIQKTSLSTFAVFSLHDDNIGVIPQLCTHSLSKILDKIVSAEWSGFTTRYWQIGDHDPCLAYLSKASWDPCITPEEVYRDHITAVLGEHAVTPMLKVFRQLEEVTIALEDHGMGLSFPVPDMGIKHFTASPMPNEFSQDRESYSIAIDELSKISISEDERGKTYLDYWRGRFKFGAGYIDFIESMRKAGCEYAGALKAQGSKNMGSYRKHLSNAVLELEKSELLARNTIETYAMVARDRSDKGAIATMAQYLVRDVVQLRENLKQELKGDK